MEYDIDGNVLTRNEEGDYSGVPEKCPECHCAHYEANWRDFSNKTIHVCEQCSHEMRVQW